MKTTIPRLSAVDLEALEREFDLAALIAMRPHLLAADRAVVRLVPEALHGPTTSVKGVTLSR